MKRISLQWRITLMTVLLIGVTCVAMNLLLCSITYTVYLKGLGVTISYTNNHVVYQCSC